MIKRSRDWGTCCVNHSLEDDEPNGKDVQVDDLG